MQASSIHAHHAARGYRAHTAHGVKDQLGRVTIGAAQEAHPLALLHPAGLEGSCAYQPDASDAAPIGAGELAPVGIPRPARHLVLHRAASALEAGGARLAMTALTAAGVAAGNRCPGAVGGGLAGRRVEAGGEGERVGQATARRLQVSGSSPRSSFQRRRPVWRMNGVRRMASSRAAGCVGAARRWYA